jgi:hypothetical protein
MEPGAARPRRRPVGAFVAVLLGGVLAVVGTLQPWFKGSGDLSPVGILSRRSRAGIHSTEGKIVFAAAIVALLLGLLVLASRTRGPRVFAGLLILVAGLAAGGYGVYDILTAKSQFIDGVLARVPEQVRASVRAILERTFDTGRLKITPQIGVYLVVIGGLLLVVGAILAMASPVTAEPAAALIPSSPWGPSRPTTWESPVTTSYGQSAGGSRPEPPSEPPRWPLSSAPQVPEPPPNRPAYPEPARRDPDEPPGDPGQEEDKPGS